MSTSVHPSAPHHLPFFVPGPDGADPVLVGAGIFLLIAVTGFGVFFLWLHTLPERIAHGAKRLQFQVVAVLGLISLFTHIHMFWIAALLLALIDLPDFTAPLRRIAGSAEKMAGLPPGAGDTAIQNEPEPHAAAEPHAPPAETEPPLPVVTSARDAKVA